MILTCASSLTPHRTSLLTDRSSSQRMVERGLLVAHAPPNRLSILNGHLSRRKARKKALPKEILYSQLGHLRPFLATSVPPLDLESAALPLHPSHAGQAFLSVTQQKKCTRREASMAKRVPRRFVLSSIWDCLAALGVQIAQRKTPERRRWIVSLRQSWRPR